MERQLAASNAQVTDLERQVKTGEDQVTDLQRQLSASNKKATDLERKLTARDEQLIYLQRQLSASNEQDSDMERQLAASSQQVADLQEQLTASNEQVTELERQVSNQLTASSEVCDWVISRDEIEMTGHDLGHGAWGKVEVGRFRRCKVAVKQMHGLVLSRHNRGLFQREMNIAARCRHPCMLQFIGATNDEGSPLFVTELMESCLRELLESEPPKLEPADISVISLDIAQALNYLHRSGPPIIHRDISSANVLLWRHGDRWRGKVSDYGTANFMHTSKTNNPGAQIYSEPEASTPNQTVKVKLNYYLLLFLYKQMSLLFYSPGQFFVPVRKIFSPQCISLYK